MKPKAYLQPGYKPNLSTKQGIRDDIIRLRDTLNANIQEMRDSGINAQIFDTAISNTMKKADAKRLNYRGELPSGYKLNKKELLSYHRELQRLETYDMFTPAAIQREEYQQKKARKEFMKNHPEFSDEDYDVMASAFGALSEAEVLQFSSDEVVKVAEMANKKHMKGNTLAKIISTKIKNSKKLGINNQEQLQMAVIRSIKYGRSGR